MSESVDVLVVGAGPTGLMLACWMARYGVRALVVDPKPGPVTETRAVGVAARTMEYYDMLGLGATALASGMPARGAAMWSHRRLVGRAVFRDMGLGLSPHPYMFMMGQDRTESMLYADLLAHGGDVRWGWACRMLTQDASGVTVTLTGPEGEESTVRAAWVAGCDGARSPVRHALGVAFEGGTYGARFYVADVTAEGPLEEGELSVALDEGRFQAFFPLPGEHHFRVVGIVPPTLLDKADLAFADLAPEVEAHTGMRVRSTSWFATYNVHHRVAARFKVGRVFLLGDAGHVHSPIGGQGMNTGLGDASNLGWKLAAVVRGEADAALLDTYEPERMPFARRLVETTDRLFSFVASPLPVFGLVRAWVVPTLFATLTRLQPLRRELFGIVSQTRIRYEGALASGLAGSVRGGDRLPWAPRPDGTSNYDALTLLRPHLQIYGPVGDDVAAWAAAHSDVPLVPQPDTVESRHVGLMPGAVYLMRPDGHVALAMPRFDGAALDAFLADRWRMRRIDVAATD